MTLVFIICVAGVLLGYLFYRDRNFEKKTVKDVVKSEDTKNFLNIPNELNHFNEDIEEARAKKPFSRQILEEMNSKE